MNMSAATKKMDLTTLLGEIARDMGNLVTEQLALFRAEIFQEAKKATAGIAEIAMGGGLTAAAGLLSGMMFAHLLQRTTKLPLWICYGFVGGAISAASFELLKSGRDKIARIEFLPPPESTAALKENVEWLKRQISTDANR